ALIPVEANPVGKCLPIFCNATHESSGSLTRSSPTGESYLPQLFLKISSTCMRYQVGAISQAGVMPFQESRVLVETRAYGARFGQACFSKQPSLGWRDRSQFGVRVRRDASTLLSLAELVRYDQVQRLGGVVARRGVPERYADRWYERDVVRESQADAEPERRERLRSAAEILVGRQAASGGRRELGIARREGKGGRGREVPEFRPYRQVTHAQPRRVRF